MDEEGVTTPLGLDRTAIEEIIFRRAPMRRYTQDSPVLPDVWFAFGEHPGARVDLLLTPHRTSSPGDVLIHLRSRLTQERETAHWQALHGQARPRPQLAYSQSAVAGRFSFDELVRVLLPLAVWERSSGGLPEPSPTGGTRRPSPPRPLGAQWIGLQRLRPKERVEMAENLIALEEGRALSAAPELVWMIRIVGTIEASQQGTLPVATSRENGGAIGEATALVESVVRLLKGAPAVGAAGPAIFTISKNRPASVAVWRSVEAVKADAARRLFNLSCAGLSWAILDSGIDATHQAFRMRDRRDKKHVAPFEKTATGWQNRTRVVATYDFTRIRELLDADGLEEGPHSPALAERLERLGQSAQDLALHLKSGRYIDWDLFAPLLEVPHTDGYEPPKHEHGTHVAGILAGDWLTKDSADIDHDLVGVCPDIQLYDIRVLGDDGTGDEFSIIAGLQFVRHLNAHKDEVVVHGVNLSLAIPHDVANYACGRTPVCDECDRLAAAGVVMVVAAGNEGYIEYLTAAGTATEGYRNISITDPGNANSVITVGSTHRYRPFTYGVSYFSSRGPTGDGRMKPDLVAPGEKIWSATPHDNVRTLDGTSMAAPHVSGCAALLMARHRELVGQPSMVKQILCRTCTDLGRERYFQGNGMVDVLRAIQSV